MICYLTHNIRLRIKFWNKALRFRFKPKEGIYLNKRGMYAMFDIKKVIITKLKYVLMWQRPVQLFRLRPSEACT